MIVADRSVWYEECDEGWVKLIPTIVTCEYEQNVFTPIHTSIHLSEQDLEDFHVYPRCTVQSIQEDFAFSRYDTARGKILSQSGTKATVQSPSLPFFLSYQINFYAQFKSDIDHITRQWREFCGRAFSLPVTLATGEEYKCNVDQTGYRNQDDIEREVRRYIRSYVYRVWVDLEGKTYEANMVTKTNLRKN